MASAFDRGLAEAHEQRAQATDQQPALERGEQAAVLGAQGLYLVPAGIRLARHQDAGQHVGMAVEILGRRVEDDVGAKRQRMGGHRGGGGRIDRQDGAGFMRQAGRLGDVDHVPGGVRRCLDPYEIGLAARDGALKPARLAGLESGQRQAAPRLLALQPVAGAVIDDLRHHHVGAFGHRLDQRHQRCHAGGKKLRFGALFQSGDDPLGLPQGGMAVPLVADGQAQAIIGIAGEGGGGIAAAARRRRLQDRRLRAHGRQWFPAATSPQTCWPPLMCSSAPLT